MRALHATLTTIAAAIICGLIFVAGSALGALFNHNASHASPATACTGLCPGSGSGGTIGTGTTFTTHSGTGGHTNP